MKRRGGWPDNAPQPAGAYSPSVQIGGLIAVSGQCGYMPDRTLVEGVAEQTRLSMNNIETALAASGATMDDVLSVCIYLTDSEHFAEMDSVYSECFREPYPARTTVYVGLKRGVLIEVDALAVLSSGSSPS